MFSDIITLIGTFGVTLTCSPIQPRTSSGRKPSEIVQPVHKAHEFIQACLELQPAVGLRFYMTSTSLRFGLKEGSEAGRSPKSNRKLIAVNHTVNQVSGEAKTYIEHI